MFSRFCLFNSLFGICTESLIIHIFFFKSQFHQCEIYFYQSISDILSIQFYSFIFLYGTGFQKTKTDGLKSDQGRGGTFLPLGHQIAFPAHTQLEDVDLLMF